MYSLEVNTLVLCNTQVDPFEDVLECLNVAGIAAINSVARAVSLAHKIAEDLDCF